MAISQLFPVTSELLDDQVVSDKGADTPGRELISAKELEDLEGGAKTMVETELDTLISQAATQADKDTLEEEKKSSSATAHALVLEALARNNAGLEPPKSSGVRDWLSRGWGKIRERL